MARKRPTKTGDYYIIFRAWFTRNGRRIEARAYGKRAFPLKIRRK